MTRGRVLILLVVLALLSACSGSKNDDAKPSDSGAAVVDGAVSGDVTTSFVAASAAPDFDAEVDPISQLVQVKTTGAVNGKVTISLPLTRKVNKDDVVFAMAADTKAGPWEEVPARVIGDRVVITTTHLSVFAAFRALASSVGDVAKAAFEGLTSQVTAEADRPSCANESGARSEGFEIASDRGDTVFWCFGKDGRAASYES